MGDTGFTVPPAKRDRRTPLYGYDDAGRLVVRQTCPGRSTVPERPDGMAFVSGGKGLWSTVDDYLRFARLFVGGGAVDGVPILSPATVAMMTTNRLSPHQRMTGEVVGMPLFRDGYGFGLGVAVVLDPERAEPVVCGGREGARWAGRAPLAGGGALTFATNR